MFILPISQNKKILDFIANAPDYYTRAINPLRGKKAIVEDFTGGVETHEIYSRRTTDSIGLICGLAPSYFYCFDVDEQHYSGISERVWDKWVTTDFYNDPRIVIEKSMSGGIHFILRCKDVGGSVKVSSRMVYSVERDKEVKETYIETRGKGGYIRVYPSVGNELITEWAYPLGMIEDWEFAELFDFFKGFDEMPEKKETVTATNKSLANKYETDPFVDYNNRQSCYDLLVQQGWSEHSKKSDRVYMTRDGKNDGISGTWFPDKNIFYCFTSSTVLEPSETYNPTSLAVLYKYGTLKDMYAAIKDEYGVLTRDESEKEANVWLSEALLRRSDGEVLTVPKVFHEEVRSAVEKKYEKALEGYVHGSFWYVDRQGDVSIDRERLYRVCNNMGVRQYMGGAIYVCENDKCPDVGNRFAKQIQVNDINKMLKSYVLLGSGEEETDETDYSIVNTLDAFMENHGKHLLAQLDSVERHDYLADDENVYRAFFKDCWVEVSGRGVSIFSYEQIPDGLIPVKKFINFDYLQHAPSQTSLFNDFLKKAVADYDYALKCIAHIVHDYKSPAMPYMIGYIEGTSDQMHIGGSGKNLLTSLVSQMVGTHHISGETLRTDAAMLQSWNGERVVSLDDLPKRFNFESLKEIVTGSTVVKHLFKNMRTVPYHELPKITFNSNHGVPLMRGDIRRRARCIEFTDFFNRAGGVARHYSETRGGLPVDWMFPNGDTWTLTESLKDRQPQRNCWDESEWKSFFEIIFKAMAKYLGGGLMLEEEPMTVSGWIKNYAHTFGDTELEYMESRFHELVGRTMSNSEVYDHYTQYCISAGILPTFRKKEKSHIGALREWCIHSGVVMTENVSVGNGRGKRFEGKDEETVKKYEEMNRIFGSSQFPIARSVIISGNTGFSGEDHKTNGAPPF